MKTHQLGALVFVCLTTMFVSSQLEKGHNQIGAGGFDKPEVTTQVTNHPSADTEVNQCYDVDNSLASMSGCDSWKVCALTCLNELQDKECFVECDRDYLDTAPTFQDSELCACQYCTNSCSAQCNCDF